MGLKEERGWLRREEGDDDDGEKNGGGYYGEFGDGVY